MRKGINKNIKNRKKLYVEPIKYYKRYKRKEFYPLLVPAFIVIMGLVIFSYVILNPIKGENPYCALVMTIPIGTIGVIVLYFKTYKCINRFIIYEDGFLERCGKKFIYFNDIDYIAVLYYVDQPIGIVVYTNDKRDLFKIYSQHELKKILKVFRDNNMQIGK